jgi:phosphoribosylformimino-5-aminoimidazole carboxamide ribotide isomerase
MELVLAMDLRRNTVVHGKSGLRSTYKPLDWGLSPTAEPVGFVKAIAPKYIYIADLDRIEGTGSHDAIIRSCAGLVECCYVDRGIRGPSDYLTGPHIKNIVGTETSQTDLSRYHGGYLSVDVKDRKVIPSGEKPDTLLKAVRNMAFEGCIILNLGFVGTEHGFTSDSRAVLEMWRSAYEGKLLYGGGVASVADLELILEAGYDGAIVATALHKGAIPVEWIRRGCMC